MDRALSPSDTAVTRRKAGVVKQAPLLVRSGLTRTVYVLTRYKRHRDGTVEALEKHDVTDEFNKLVADIDRPPGPALVATALSYCVPHQAVDHDDGRAWDACRFRQLFYFENPRSPRGLGR